MSHRVGGRRGAIGHCHRSTVGNQSQDRQLWRERFAQEGLESLWEIAPGRGRKPTYGPEKIKAIVDATLAANPRE